MKIAFFLGEFPAVSQTFVLDQIVGLIQRGHEVDIFANVAGRGGAIHPEIQQYRLLERTHYWPNVPKNHLLRTFKGVKLAVLNLFKDPRLVLNSLNIFKFGRDAASLRLLYICIPFVDRRTDYDIIQCHFGWSGLQGMYAREIGAVSGKLITTFHGFDLTRSIQEFGESVYASLFSKGDLFSPISDYWRHRLVKMGCAPHKVWVHHMGVDLRKFSTSAPSARKPEETVRLISVARFVEKKGLEYGIRAVTKLLKAPASSHPASSHIEYTLIGDGELWDDLKQLVAELGVSENIILCGQKRSDQVVDQLNQSHILIAPSVTSKDGDMEGIPVVLMEAMAMGLPVVSTCHSGIPELVEDGVSGFLVPEREIEGLADKIRDLIENPEASAQMGQAGRLKIERDYSVEKLNDRLEKLYQDLQGG
ncbi:MAG: glycosyltransferase [Cyanobacteria bacterium P01_A01_bin.114]